MPVRIVRRGIESDFVQINGYFLQKPLLDLVETINITNFAKNEETI